MEGVLEEEGEDQSHRRGTLEFQAQEVAEPAAFLDCSEYFAVAAAAVAFVVVVVAVAVERLHSFVRLLNDEAARRRLGANEIRVGLQLESQHRRRQKLRFASIMCLCANI